MLGNLSRAMVHELNHKLSPIAFAIEDLEEKWQTVADTTNTIETTRGAVAETSQYMHELSISIEGLMHTAKLFGELTAQTEEELIKVEEVVDDVVWIVKDLARDYKTLVEWEKPEKMHLTRANPAQLQQVLLNTMVNSLQQIDGMRSHRNQLLGLIQVGVAYKTEGDQALIEISIRDNGPGIHHAIWDRIFECGYTLGRRDGNGLGLFISKNLLQSINGSIYVKDSQRLWGTTFHIQLPIVLVGQ